MSLETKGFEFDEFFLDRKEKLLLRQGKPVSITPKTYYLLLTLVENHGRIVEKNELMKAVWADSFVEEGNLTFTIRLLRKALGDDKQQPRFIETVPRRGYRFIAEVTETPEKNDPDEDSAPALEQVPEETSARSPKKTKIFLLPAIFVLLFIFIGFWYVVSKNKNLTTPVLTAPFSSEKLSTNGKAFYAVISPDGKNVVYVNEINGKQSVWIRQLETSNNVEIIPPTDNIYHGLAFSPDGKTLYFNRLPRTPDGQGDVYRVSVFGGVPTKIVNEAQGWISISPDGAKISFVRCYYQEEENCSLWIADSADGKNEKKLASRPRPIRIGDNKFSPDGHSIAFAVGQSENQANEFSLVEIDLESGKERELSAEKFFNIKFLTWLPDKSGLLITASRVPNKNFRIWQVSLATGQAEPLTKDSEAYLFLSLDKEADLLVSTQVNQDFRLRIWNLDNPMTAKRELADATEAVFSPNGKIIFSSIMAGNDEIWSINADGSEQRQLTNEPADHKRPVVSSTGDWIFFASNRTGAAQVWRMNSDGSNQIQITQNEGGFPLFVSSDENWLYYHKSLTRTLWRISIKDGEDQLVLDKRINNIFFSPDGTKIAFSERQGDEQVLTIVSLPDGQIVKTFHLPDKKAGLHPIAWLPDGKSVAYILSRVYENNTLWLQPLDGRAPRQIADLGEEEVNSLAFSSDGKSFAVVQGSWKHDAVLLKGLK